MDETKTYVFNPDNNNNVPAWMAMNNGGLFGNNGWGGGIIGFILGILLGNNGLFGGWGGNGFGGGNLAAGYLGNQINNDNNTDLVMNAINGTDADVRLLATTLNADVNEVKSAINTVQSAIQNVGAQVGMSGLQVINAIQSGNASIASQLCQCCCENRLLTTQQGYESQIRTLEQTNQLGSQADRNANNIISAINAQTVAMNDQFCAAKERDMQEKIDSLLIANSSLKSQIDNANQTNQIIGYVNSVVTPLQVKINEIADKQPNTVPVQWPNLTAVNNTPYFGNYYGNGGSYWG
jgi:hypothetical protein